MPELGKSGSVGAVGEQSPAATRPNCLTTYTRVWVILSCHHEVLLA